MKKFAFVLLFVIGCSSGGDTPAPPPEHRGGVIETTSYPLQYVVTRIGGSRVEVRFRAAGSADPAYWRPTADEVVAMQEADLIAVNGAGYEPWLVDVSLPVSRIVDTTAPWQDRLVAVEDRVTHSHGPGGEHEHVGTAFTTWLDLSLFARQVETVAEAMKTRWPEHEAEFARRAEELVAELEGLDAEFGKLSEPLAERSLVFSHPVYQYLQARYGVQGPSVHWEPDVTPGADDWVEFDHLIEHDGIDTMVWEAAPTPETLDQLQDRGLRAVMVEPCATAPVDGDFLSVMRANLAALNSIAEH